MLELNVNIREKRISLRGSFFLQPRIKCRILKEDYFREAKDGKRKEWLHALPKGM